MILILYPAGLIFIKQYSIIACIHHHIVVFPIGILVHCWTDDIVINKKDI